MHDIATNHSRQAASASPPRPLSREIREAARHGAPWLIALVGAILLTFIVVALAWLAIHPAQEPGTPVPSPRPQPAPTAPQET